MKVNHAAPEGRVRQRISAFELGNGVIAKTIAKPTMNPLKNVRNIISKMETTFNLDKKMSLPKTSSTLTAAMANMVRPSKFRHVYCCVAATNSVTGFSFPINEKPIFDLNSHYCAVAFKHRFFVFPWSPTTANPADSTTATRTHSQEPLEARYDGVKLLDLKWNPHDSDVLAFSGTGGSVQIWKVVAEASASGGKNCRHRLARWASLNHSKDVHLLCWHPTIADYLISASSDHKIVFWNAATGSKLSELSIHRDLVCGLSWSADGRFLATSSKDGYVRVVDATMSVVVSQFSAHAASKHFRVTVLKDGRIFTSGLTKSSMRQIALWDAPPRRDEQQSATTTIQIEPLFKETVDHGSGCFHHLYDPDLGLVYLMAKGEAGFRVFEITDEKPFCHFLTRYSIASQSLASDLMVPLPKTALDADRCEIQRLVRLNVAKRRLEQISVRVPRRYPQSFKSDLYSKVEDDNLSEEIPLFPIAIPDARESCVL